MVTAVTLAITESGSKTAYFSHSTPTAQCAPFVCSMGGCCEDNLCLGLCRGPFMGRKMVHAFLIRGTGKIWVRVSADPWGCDGDTKTRTKIMPQTYSLWIAGIRRSVDEGREAQQHDHASLASPSQRGSRVKAYRGWGLTVE